MFARTCCLPCNCNHGFFSLQISSVSAVARTLRRVSPAKDPDDRLQGAATDLRDSLTMSAQRGILLQKSFRGGERKFLEPLMRLARGDVRDHIASSKINHGPP